MQAPFRCCRGYRPRVLPRRRTHLNHTTKYPPCDPLELYIHLRLPFKSRGPHAQRNLLSHPHFPRRTRSLEGPCRGIFHNSIRLDSRCLRTPNGSLDRRPRRGCSQGAPSRPASLPPRAVHPRQATPWLQTPSQMPVRAMPPLPVPHLRSMPRRERHSVQVRLTAPEPSGFYSLLGEDRIRPKSCVASKRLWRRRHAWRRDRGLVPWIRGRVLSRGSGRDRNREEIGR